MEPYCKIQTLFKRDPDTHKLLIGEYSRPEFEYLKNNTWLFTEKVDGTNIRVMSLPHGEVVFSGKTNNSQISAKLVKRLIELFPHHGKLAELFPDGGCLYGEGFGAGIAKGGGNYSKTQDFVLFDVKVGDWWLERENIKDVADNLEIPIVPVVDWAEGATLKDMSEIIREGGFPSYWGNFLAEGIVARPKVTLLQRDGERIITKLKTKDFK